MAANSGNNQPDEAGKRPNKKGTQKYIVPPKEWVDIEAVLAKLETPESLLAEQLPLKNEKSDYVPTKARKAKGEMSLI